MRLWQRLESALRVGYTSVCGVALVVMPACQSSPSLTADASLASNASTIADAVSFGDTPRRAADAVPAREASGLRPCTPDRTASATSCTGSSDCSADEVCVFSSGEDVCLPAKRLGDTCTFFQRPSDQPVPCYNDCGYGRYCIGDCYVDGCQGICADPVGQPGAPCDDFVVSCAAGVDACMFPPDGGRVGRCR